MQIKVAYAFGKLRRDDFGAVTAWHPLVDHMIDVAACFERLCRCRSIRRALEMAAQRHLDAVDIARLAVLAFLHDLGKANSGFQSKRWLNGRRPPEWPAPAGHGSEARLVFTEACASLAELLPIDKMDGWGDATWSLLLASISHHGRPITEDPAKRHCAVWATVIGANGIAIYEPALVLQRLGESALALYPEAFAAGGEPLPDSPAFGHLFAGLVQLADWLGSDTDLLPFSEEDEVRADTAPDYAAKAIAALGLDTEDWRERVAALSPTFAHTFGNPPYPIQAAMDDPELGPLVILESETGSGKTEAALWRFLNLFRTGRVDGLYFALPTRVSASQAYRRIRDAVERLWPSAAPVVVRALPGYAAADGHEVKALPDFKVQWPDDPDDAVAQRRWAAESPKRFLAAPIAVGTVDQALFGALQVRHAHLRHALLARSLLVVDEVHASDPYMTVLLEHLLKAHLHCGGHALLLSATLGSSARDRYLALAPQRKPTEAVTTGFDAACAAPYPAVADFSGIRAIASVARIKRVEWTLHDAIDDPVRIARMALNAAQEDAKVLVIRNTVSAAVAVLKALEEDGVDPEWLFAVGGVRTLHHSRFSRQDRPLLDAAIETRLGKTRRSGPLIVIGTQTLEQSLDIDADLLITDLCPMDVLLQRIGRLHRHQRLVGERPVPFRVAQALVLTPAGHDLAPMLKKACHGLGPSRGGGGVYPDLRAVEATRRLVEDHPTVEIPTDNRYLVEAATHREKLHAIEQEGGEAWQQLAQKVEGEAWAQRTVGHQSALEWDKHFDEQQAFPTEIDIATRLGARDRLLQFDPAPPGPFGVPLCALPVRHFLLPSGLDPDAQPANVVHRDGTTEFTLGAARYRYSRFGLERLNDE